MKTALHDRHVALGAKMVDFAGWEMPLSYKGVLSEHHAVRRSVGLFDVSHMGYIDIKGPEAEAFLDYVSTNVVVDRPDNSAIYTIIGSDSGGCVDDLIIFRLKADHFFCVTNASNRRSDLEHLQRVAKGFRVMITPGFDTHGILALQGPVARQLLIRFMGYEPRLNSMQCTTREYGNGSLIISRTGYTGSFGYEFFGPTHLIVDTWDSLLKLGREYGLEPAGLAARDTLRLEAGFPLYGHELSLDIAPTESVSEWTVRWKKARFLGKKELIRLESSPKKRSQHGLVVLDKGVPRSGNLVYKNGQQIGIVTSGSYSPCLEKGIAIIMITGKIAFSENLEVESRGRRLLGQVVKLPFYKA